MGQERLCKEDGESAMNLDLLKRVEAQLETAIKTVHVKAHR
jgi:hypothetical protein